MKGHMKTFNELKIDSALLAGIEKMKFEHMTEVQEKVIPIALEGKDVIAQAPTGTGKTVTYAVPVVNKIDGDLKSIQAIIIAPTRELAVQISKEINTVAYFLKDIKAVALYGGEHIEKQITALKRKPQIIVCTPGRMMDHMNRKSIRLNDVKTVVLDEADEMLDMGFKEDIDYILSAINSEHQTMLFSATISKDIEKIANTFLKEPESVRISKNELTVSLIEQKYIELKEKDKVEVISRLIDINEYKLVMVFCNTKRMVDEATSQLLMRGYLAEALHGDMKQMQRDRVMSRFKSGQINILVASDVAARGLDVNDVDVVINYDVPTDEEYYVHRIGRTGRAEKSGLSITLVTRNEKNRLRTIMRYTKAEIDPMTIPALEKVMKIKVKRIIEKSLELSLEESNYQKYISKSLDSIEGVEFSKDDLIKGLILSQLQSTDNNIEIIDIKDEIKKREKQRDKDYIRVFINIGKKDRIKVYNLTDWFVKNTSLTNSDINGIDIRDNFTFCDIPSNALEEVLQATESNFLNSKKIIVEVAKSKGTQKSSHSRSSQSRSSQSRSSQPRSSQSRSSRGAKKEEHFSSDNRRSVEKRRKKY